MPASTETCPLCGRELIDGPSVNEHHLVPRTYRGRVTVRMHRICHNKIHSVFSEKELADYYHTPDRLLENEEICKFVKWVRKKDPGFYDRHRAMSKRR
ncbi:HNH endonuclease [Noviherbaspirillum sp.]|uniref:HNH endonuclease n=1 Tax=Noviherbaspirillum sp. TaxID=1926288 RepID=UPI002FE23AE2